MLPTYSCSTTRSFSPQLLPLIQARRLTFLGHVARMSDSLDISTALKVSNFVGCLGTGGVVADGRVTLGFVIWKPQKSWTGLRMEICPGPVTMEAFSRNGYTQARGTPVIVRMMMMMTLLG